MLEHRQLLYFLSVVREGSFRKAADAQNITPPALTKSLKNLEDRLGVQLFEREYGSAKLTAFGSALVEPARSLVLASEGIENHLAQIANLESGHLSVGAGVVAMGSILSKSVMPICEQYPKVKFNIHADRTPALEKQLRNGEIEFFVGYYRAIEKIDDLEIIELRKDPLILVCHKDHPLSGEKSLSIKEISRYPIISSPLPHDVRRTLDLGFHELVKPYLQITSNCLNLIKKAIMDKNHLALGTELLFEDEITAGEAIALHTEKRIGYTSPGIVSKKGQSLSPAAQQLIDNICSEYCLDTNMD